MTDREAQLDELRQAQDRVPDEIVAQAQAAKVEEMKRRSAENFEAKKRAHALSWRITEVAHLADTLANHRLAQAEDLREAPLSDPQLAGEVSMEIALADPARVREAVMALRARDPERMAALVPMLDAAGPRAREAAALFALNEPERMAPVLEWIRTGGESLAPAPEPEPAPVAEPAPGLAGIVEHWGGLKPTLRRAVGLALRDGPSAVRSGLAVPEPETTAAPAPDRPPREPRWYDAETPEVSVVVLNYGKSLLTLECVRSLWKHTTGYRYEIVVVDNGSSQRDYAGFAGIDGPCRLVRIPVNRFFGEGNNLGVEAARAPIVVLMNNDVTLTTGWLEPLVERLTQTPDCGVAGPMFLYPNGVLQEAGGLMDEQGFSVQLGKHQSADDPVFGRPRVVDYVSAACMAVRKEDFERVRGFEMRYEPAYYEDADFCMKLRRLGLLTYYVPESRVIHHESATTRDTLAELNLVNLGEVNRMKFRERWTDYLRGGRPAPAPEARALLACGSSEGRRTVAFHVQDELSPGGRMRAVMAVMERALGAGEAVHLVTPEPYSLMRVTALAETFGFDLDGLCLISPAEAGRLPLFDDFVAVGSGAVPSESPLGRRNTFWSWLPLGSGLGALSRGDELRLADYDRIVVDSPAGAAALRGAGIEAPAILVVPPLVVTGEAPGRTVRTGIVSVGRFAAGAGSNRQDAQIEAFRRLVESGAADGLRLNLVGGWSVRPDDRQYLIDCVAAAEGLDVKFWVDADSAELSALLKSCAVYWDTAGLGSEGDLATLPQRGAGPIEAMSAGCVPVVASGEEGSVRDGIEGVVVSGLGELVEATREMLTTDAEHVDTLRRAGLQRAAALGGAATSAVDEAWELGLRAELSVPMDD